MYLTKKEYAELLDCTELRTRTNGDEFHIIKDGTSDKVAELARDAMYELDSDINSLDIVNDMLHDALYTLSDEVEYKDLKKYDVYNSDHEHASVYTATRLGYLTISNQDEISDKMHEYGDGTDIATACAIWYDVKTNALIANLVERITK